MLRSFFSFLHSNNPHWAGDRSAVLILVAILLGLSILAYYFTDINFPFGLGTYSRALYVDEGFYSDAAQNFIKYGAWHLPHDVRFWPGAPTLLILQTAAFSIFDTNLTVARMLSVVFSILGGLAVYWIARTRFNPLMSVVVALLPMLSISFVTHARSALGDPIAMAMALFSILVYVRMGNRLLAIPVSLMLAALAMLSKIYFLFCVAAIVVLWLGELVISPILHKKPIDRRLLVTLTVTVLSLGLAYYAYGILFHDAISSYMYTNVNKKPVLHIVYLINAFLDSLKILPLNTKASVFIGVLVLSGVYCLIILLLAIRDFSFSKLVTFFNRFNRAEWAMALFLCIGLVTIGILKLHKTHYHFFAIIPLGFLSFVAIQHILPSKLRNIASIGIILLHLNVQIPYYEAWFDRSNNESIKKSSEKIVKRIFKNNTQELVPVIGEYASQLGLYDRRILPLDGRWSTREALCARLVYWKPIYHVNIVWPNSRSSKELSWIAMCPQVIGYEEIRRHPTFLKFTKDEIVLSRLIYAN